MKHWKNLLSNSLINDKFMRLRADRIMLPSGQIIDPYYVITEPDWVHVFVQDDQGRVLVVGQYRYAVDDWCFELPGGNVDRGEEPIGTAYRELLEETGYSATLQPIGSMYALGGRMTNRIHTFCGTDPIQQGPQHLEPSEELTFEFRSIGDIKSMIANGQFSQANHIASFYLCLEALK